jgi:hypothetical protein
MRADSKDNSAKGQCESKDCSFEAHRHTQKIIRGTEGLHCVTKKKKKNRRIRKLLIANNNGQVRAAQHSPLPLAARTAPSGTATPSSARAASSSRTTATAPSNIAEMFTRNVPFGKTKRISCVRPAFWIVNVYVTEMSKGNIVQLTTSTKDEKHLFDK